MDRHQEQKGKDMQGEAAKRPGAWMGFVVLFLLLVLGLMRLFMQAPDEIRSTGDAQTRAGKTLAMAGSEAGLDMGLVLIDIPTRQAAIAFRVPRTGVYVLAVDQGGPAEAAALRPGDCICKIDGETVNNAEELTAALGGLGRGETAELTVLRGLEEMVVHIMAEQAETQL